MISAVKKSISGKFMLAVLATTLSTLLFAGAAMLAYDLQNFETVWVNDLTAQSNILAQISLPALEFNDCKIATENLEQLKARPAISAGAIYTPDGKLFAKYANASATSFVFPRTPGPNGYSIATGKIRIFKQITRDGEAVGTVFLQAQYPLADRIKRYLAIFSVVLMGGLFIAAFVSFWLQKPVTRPIRALTNAVHQVIGISSFLAYATTMQPFPASF